MPELTEEEQKTLRQGLRMLARMIARRHLAVRAAAQAQGDGEAESAHAGGASANGNGTEA